jgi:hypothetical protein
LPSLRALSGSATDGFCRAVVGRQSIPGRRGKQEGFGNQEFSKLVEIMSIAVARRDARRDLASPTDKVWTIRCTVAAGAFGQHLRTRLAKDQSHSADVVFVLLNREYRWDYEARQRCRYSYPPDQTDKIVTRRYPFLTDRSEYCGEVISWTSNHVAPSFFLNRRAAEHYVRSGAGRLAAAP